MCANCREREADPRNGAFVQAGLITVVPQSELDKTDGLPPMATVLAFEDSGVAKFKSFTMMSDPAWAKITHSDYTICLN